MRKEVKARLERLVEKAQEPKYLVIFELKEMYPFLEKLGGLMLYVAAGYHGCIKGRGFMRATEVEKLKQDILEGKIDGEVIIYETEPWFEYNSEDGVIFDKGKLFAAVERIERGESL